MFAAPTGLAADSSIETSPIIAALQSYSNIHLRNINLRTYAADTPFEDFLRTEKLFLSEYLNSHVSDFLRYLTLYKFGGYYFDLDVVVQKSMDDIEPNFTGAEQPDVVAAGVISFDNGSTGRMMADECAR